MALPKQNSTMNSSDADLSPGHSKNDCKTTDQENKVTNGKHDNDMHPQVCESLKSGNANVDLFAPDTGPSLYPVKGKIVTPTLITKNLPELFKFLPIFGCPDSKAEAENFYEKKVQEFVGCGINDEDFKKLSYFCR